MGCMVTRPGIAVHAYGVEADRPDMVFVHAMTATVQHPTAGRSLMPVSAPVASFAADGAPFYNTGYMPPSPSVFLPGGLLEGLRLPPRAARLDLTDRQSWDRPVVLPGAF